MQTQNLFPEHWQEIYENLPPFITRKLLSEKSGNIIAVGTLANRDCLGIGIPNKKQIGKRICYPKADAIRWLMEYTGETTTEVAYVK